jgi:hypothetical protein
MDTLPLLGETVPAAILKSHVAGHTCDTGGPHPDPCVAVHLRRDRIAIAWDATTTHVTYLYSTTLVTDSEIEIGGLGRIDPTIHVIPFPIAAVPQSFVSPEWSDTDTDLSGDAVWYAVMKPAGHRYGKVLGFVQSIYLYVPDIDAAPLHPAGSVLPNGPTARGPVAS